MVFSEKIKVSKGHFTRNYLHTEKSDKVFNAYPSLMENSLTHIFTEEALSRLSFDGENIMQHKNSHLKPAEFMDSYLIGLMLDGKPIDVFLNLHFYGGLKEPLPVFDIEPRNPVPAFDTDPQERNAWSEAFIFNDNLLNNSKSLAAILDLFDGGDFFMKSYLNKIKEQEVATGKHLIATYGSEVLVKLEETFGKELVTKHLTLDETSLIFHYELEQGEYDDYPPNHSFWLNLLCDGKETTVAVAFEFDYDNNFVKTHFVSNTASSLYYDTLSVGYIAQCFDLVLKQ